MPRYLPAFLTEEGRIQVRALEDKVEAIIRAERLAQYTKESSPRDKGWIDYPIAWVIEAYTQAYESDIEWIEPEVPGAPRRARDVPDWNSPEGPPRRDDIIEGDAPDLSSFAFYVAEMVHAAKASHTAFHVPPRTAVPARWIFKDGSTEPADSKPVDQNPTSGEVDEQVLAEMERKAQYLHIHGHFTYTRIGKHYDGNTEKWLQIEVIRLR